jgi:hypothetical protein
MATSLIFENFNFNIGLNEFSVNGKMNAWWFATNLHETFTRET